MAQLALHQYRWHAEFLRLDERPAEPADFPLAKSFKKERKMRPLPLHPHRIITIILLSHSVICGAEEMEASSVSSATLAVSSGTIAAHPALTAPTSVEEHARPIQALALLKSKPEATIPDPRMPATTAAIADGFTTGMAISSGAMERNPLVTPTPLGLIALTGMKLGLIKYADTLPESEKRFTLKSTSAVWGGAAINNLMVLLAAPPPLPLISGLIMGLATWIHLEKQYEEKDQWLAMQNKSSQQTEGGIEPVSLSQTETSITDSAANQRLP